MEGIQTLKGSWPWPSIGPYGISSCISHRRLPIYQISFKLKKLFVDGRTYGQTDISPLYFIRSTLGSRPKNIKTVSGPCDTCFWYVWAMAVRNTSLGGAEWLISYRHRSDTHWSHFISVLSCSTVLVCHHTPSLRRFITVKAHRSMTHLKQQKSLGLFSIPLGRGFNRSHILHPWPSRVLKETKWFLLF